MSEQVQAQKDARRVPLLVRGLLIFLVILALFAGLWWFCLHHYGNAGAWAGDEPDIKSDILYEDKVFHLAGKVGAYGLTSGKFMKTDLLGEIRPAGKDALTDTYLLYTVKNNKRVIDERYMIVVYSDGVSYVYYLDGEENPYKGEWPTYDESEDK